MVQHSSVWLFPPIPFSFWMFKVKLLKINYSQTEVFSNIYDIMVTSVSWVLGYNARSWADISLRRIFTSRSPLAFICCSNVSALDNQSRWQLRFLCDNPERRKRNPTPHISSPIYMSCFSLSSSIAQWQTADVCLHPTSTNGHAAFRR